MKKISHPTLEPLMSILWTEGAIGCKINFTGKKFWSEKTGKLLDKEIIKKHTANWIKLYKKHITFLEKNFPNITIGQSILRGPLDMIGAAIGEDNMIFLMLDEPLKFDEYMQIFSEIFLEFAMLDKTYCEQDIYSVGQYHIASQGKTLRMQEDAMTLLSPSLYKKHVFAVDREIMEKFDLALFHLHASALHMVDMVTEVPTS